MNYILNTGEKGREKQEAPVSKILPLLAPEKKSFAFAITMVLITSLLNLLGPFLLGIAVDTYIQHHEYTGALVISGILFFIFLGALVSGFLQTRTMGSIGQRTLFRLRNELFMKIQSLPIAFFHQNKAGDLISRINNDTEKLNQFFSQSLVQFFGNIFIMLGAAGFILVMNWRLGLAALAPAAVVVICTNLVSPLVKKWNGASLRATGGLSSEIQESLGNFKAIVMFNRRDYFKKRFAEVNTTTFKTAMVAGIANQMFTPLYGLSYHIAQMIVLLYGISLILSGACTVGVVISFLAFTNRFYEPMRFLAAIWASFQVALAAWDRISDILRLNTDLILLEKNEATKGESHVLEFQNVAFAYEDGKDILTDISLTLDAGKTYALVGPTGGGKTTTASLMARLYDPTRGTVYLNGEDIRTYTVEERTKQIGVILQDPFLFSGTVFENILYGNEELALLTLPELEAYIQKEGLGDLLKKFPEGLSTTVSLTAESVSLGQKQLIAFMRAVLRKPALLILDEATANVDTVTEEVLEEILKKLPKETIKVIIAHRLNTIENADTIFFVNRQTLTRAGSMQEALDLLLHGERKS